MPGLQVLFLLTVLYDVSEWKALLSWQNFRRLILMQMKVIADLKIDFQQ